MEIKEVDSNLKQEKHRALKVLEQSGKPSPIKIVEAGIEDLRERQYWAYRKGGSSIEEAAALSGWTPPKK